jgi:hypothetical protein
MTLRWDDIINGYLQIECVDADSMHQNRVRGEWRIVVNIVMNPEVS